MPNRSSSTISRHAQQLKHLQERFEAFRRSHSPGTRMPDALRRDVMILSESGVSASVLIKTCKISPSVFYSWRKKRIDSPSPVPILTVVDTDIKPTPRSPSSPTHPIEFKIGIGEWALHLRLEPVLGTENR